MTSVSVAFAPKSELFEKKITPFHPQAGMENSTKYMQPFMKGLGFAEPKAELIPNAFPPIGVPQHRDSFYNSSATRYNLHLVQEPTNIFGKTSTVQGAWYSGEVKSYVPLKGPCDDCKQIDHGFQKRFVNKVL